MRMCNAFAGKWEADCLPLGFGLAVDLLERLLCHQGYGFEVALKFQERVVVEEIRIVTVGCFFGSYLAYSSWGCRSVDGWGRPWLRLLALVEAG